MSRSLFGSVKAKLSRKGTNSSQKSNDSSSSSRNRTTMGSPEEERNSRGPFELPTSSPRVNNNPYNNNNNNNPFSNPSPPTRRPPVDEPPPAYTPTPVGGPCVIPSPVGGACVTPSPVGGARITLSRVGRTRGTPSPGGARLNAYISEITAIPVGGRVRGSSPAPSLATSIAPSIASLSTDQDPYAFLSTFDTIFLIDDSASMAGPSWREARAALRAISPICASHDSDGIDVYFLHNKSSAAADPRHGKPAGGYRGIRDAASVDRLFDSVRPRSVTPLGTRLGSILRPYVQLCTQNADNLENVKPINIIVITDGKADDDPESILVDAANKLDKIEAPPYQVGVQFFRIGNDPEAKAFLKHLDNDLAEMVAGGIRDMVDTSSWDRQREENNRTLSADGILKVVLGAVIKRLDRRLD